MIISWSSIQKWIQRSTLNKYNSAYRKQNKHKQTKTREQMLCDIPERAV